MGKHTKSSRTVQVGTLPPMVYTASRSQAARRRRRPTSTKHVALLHQRAGQASHRARQVHLVHPRGQRPPRAVALAPRPRRPVRPALRRVELERKHLAWREEQDCTSRRAPRLAPALPLSTAPRLTPCSHLVVHLPEVLEQAPQVAHRRPRVARRRRPASRPLHVPLAPARPGQPQLLQRAPAAAAATGDVAAAARQVRERRRRGSRARAKRRRQDLREEVEDRQHRPVGGLHNMSTARRSA